MSFTKNAEISASARESREKVDGKRVVDRIELEVSKSIPSQEFNGSGRSDWFEGTAYQLTISQAEVLAESLGKQIELLRQMENQGQIVLKR